jgi:hypothetical protein
MLIREPKRQYFVYPAYAKFQYKWKDLPVLFTDPCKYSESWQTNPFNPKEYGYPETIQPFELVDGPVGGGIIIAHTGFVGERKIPEKWLPAIILIEGANLCSPDSMYETKDFNVCYLEPMYNEAADYGVGRQVKQYHIGSTVEHIDSASGRIFWLFKVVPSRKDMPGLADVPLWAKHFGMEVERMAEIPPKVVAEVGEWLVERDTQYMCICFDVKSSKNSMGYNFAVLIYIGLHLASLAPRRMGRVHLLAEIEGNVRSEWWSRWKRKHNAN